MADLPSQWTHEPGAVLRFRAGDTVADIDTDSTPGFTGSQGRRRHDPGRRATSASPACRRCCTPTARQGDRARCCWYCRAWTPRARAASSKHVVGAGKPDGHPLHRLRETRPTRSGPTTSCGGSPGRCRRPGTSGCSTAHTTRTCWWSGSTNLVPPDVWEARYDEINTFESELVDSGMTLVKVAMFVSLDEQKRRLAERLERPDKYWKYNPGDLDERKLWPVYQEAYQAVLDRTSTDDAPVVRGAVRQEVVQPTGRHRTAHRGAQGHELVTGPRRISTSRRRSKKAAPALPRMRVRSALGRG